MLETQSDAVDSAAWKLRTGGTLDGGRFVVIRELGRGGRGVVYEALDRASDRKVAIKLARHRSAQASLDLRREYRALTSVSHRNVVRAGDFVAGESGFFTMERIEGCEVSEWISASTAGRDRTPLRIALSDLARGVQAIHRAGLVHCDLKPSNVLVSRTGHVTILDLGLATARGRALQPHVPLSGTPAYVAPELLRRSHVDPSMDIYAIGVILYEALTGRLPFGGRSYEILFQKQWFNPPPPGTLCTGISPRLDRFCMDLLARDPRRRPGLDEVVALAQPDCGTA